MTPELSEQSDTPKIQIMGNNELHVNMSHKEGKKVLGVVGLELSNELMSQLANSIPNMEYNKQGELKINAALAMMEEIGPRDGLEGMLATQMVAVHNLSLECVKRAGLPDQTVEGVSDNINRVTKLMRTFTAQMEALQRHRNGGKQTISVQHVNVENGGQAIVGNIKGGGGRNG